MDTKFNLQDLVEIVAHKNQISRKEADAFVRTFFDTISTFLLHDKIVKVKGLGTFKLVEVSDRESIDVNTGRRIMISGHSKVSFTPDNSLRDQVNKPFIDFETVILNDGTDIEEMERIDTPTLDSGEDVAASKDETEKLTETLLEPAQVSVVEEAVEEPVEEENAEVQEESVDEHETAQPVEETTVQEEPAIPSAEAEPVKEEDKPEEICVDAAEEPETAEPSVSHHEDEEKAQHIAPAAAESPLHAPHPHEERQFVAAGESGGDNNSSTWTRMAKYAFVLLLMIGSYFVGYYRLLCPCIFCDEEIEVQQDAPQTAPAGEKQEKAVKATVKDTATIAVDSVRIKDSAATPEKAPEEAAKTAEKKNEESKVVNVEQYPQIPGGKYLIVGTRGIHVMERGDNLYKIARENYGHNDFVRYIIVYNQFKNPDVIPPGYSIKLPELKEVK